MGLKNKFSPRGDIKHWEAKDLYNVLNNPKAKAEVKDKIMNEFKDREIKNKPLVDAFFNPSKNKFWNLAKWQLYREGKARVYGHGKYLRFDIDNPTLIFDKMIEVKDAYDNFKTGKNPDERKIADTVREELQVWKR